MKTKSILGIAFAVAMSSVSADDTVYYLQPNEGGYAYTAAFTNAALWKASDGVLAGEAGEALRRTRFLPYKARNPSIRLLRTQFRIQMPCSRENGWSAAPAAAIPDASGSLPMEMQKPLGTTGELAMV